MRRCQWLPSEVDYFRSRQRFLHVLHRPCHCILPISVDIDWHRWNGSQQNFAECESQYLFKVMIMCAHFILAFLLILGGLSRDGLAIMINFIGGEYVIGVIRSKFEVMRFELMQFLVIEFGLVYVVPCPIEHLICSGKGSFFAYAKAVAAEWVVGLVLVGISLLGVVILVVNRTVVLRVIAEIEVSGSLVHCCYIYSTIQTQNHLSSSFKRRRDNCSMFRWEGRDKMISFV